MQIVSVVFILLQPQVHIISPDRHARTRLCILESSKCSTEGGESDCDGESSGHSAGLRWSSVAAPLPRFTVPHLRTAGPSDSYQWCVASTRLTLFQNTCGRIERGNLISAAAAAAAAAAASVSSQLRAGPNTNDASAAAPVIHATQTDKWQQSEICHKIKANTGSQLVLPLLHSWPPCAARPTRPNCFLLHHRRLFPWPGLTQDPCAFSHFFASQWSRKSHVRCSHQSGETLQHLRAIKGSVRSRFAG